MASKTNIINHQEVSQFLERLKEYSKPKVYSYIDQVVRNYLYRDAKVKRVFPQFFLKTTPELKEIIKKGGPFHHVVLDTSIYNELRNVVDYISSLEEGEERILRISVNEATRHHEAWVKRLNNKKDTSEGEVLSVVNFKNGYKLVKLEDKRAYEREGKLMKHCVGTYSTSSKIYSLRDEYNHPQVTLEVRGSEVVQLRQACNAVVDKKFYPYIKQFLKLENLTIPKVVGSAGNAFSTALTPAMVTFIAFQWKTLLSWIGGEGAQNGVAMVSNPTLSSGLSLVLLILAFKQWIDYISNFDPGGERSTGLPVEEIEGVDEIELADSNLNKKNSKY